MPLDALLAIQVAGHLNNVEAMGRRVVANGPGYRVVAETCQSVTADGWAEWRILATNLGDEELPLTLEWSWRPSTPVLTGPLRIVQIASPSSVTSRSIGRFDGSMRGARIDGPAGSMVRDTIQFVLPPHGTFDGELICLLAPCHPADFDGDGSVGPLDMAFLVASLGETGSIGDLDGDGSVDAVDLRVLLSSWGH